MKILLSAFACRPHYGSELGAGWNIAIEIAKRGHQVWVITALANKVDIEKEFNVNKAEYLNEIKFIYYQLPEPLLTLKDLSFLKYIYYYLWQLGVYFIVKKAHQEQKFDLVHHVTYGCFRLPSLMGNLGIPFIWGPVGGGEAAPWRLRKSYSIKGKVMDLIRDMTNYMTFLDPLMWNTYLKSTKIYAATKETKRFIPKCFHYKVKLKIHSGIEEKSIAPKKDIESKFNQKNDYLKLLYVGRLIHWKGVHIALMALAEILKSLPNTKLTLIARGDEEEKLQKLAEELNIGHAIIWQKGWITNEELEEAYYNHNLFIFPSLHDSGGMAPIEAMTKGLPVICLDLGGPGVSVNQDCGRVINTGKNSERQVAKLMANEMVKLWNAEKELKRMALASIDRARVFSWENRISDIYKNIE